MTRSYGLATLQGGCNGKKNGVRGWKKAALGLNGRSGQPPRVSGIPFRTASGKCKKLRGGPCTGSHNAIVGRGAEPRVEAMMQLAMVTCEQQQIRPQFATGLGCPGDLGSLLRHKPESDLSTEKLSPRWSASTRDPDNVLSRQFGSYM